MMPMPSLRTCLDLFVLRLRLPRMMARQPLDMLLDRLGSWRPRDEDAVRERRVLDESIEVTEAVITRLRLAPDTCLYRSMARYALLRGHGVAARFFMGVTPPPDSSAGHAWVEDEAGPYREGGLDGGYVVTFRHPRAAEGESSERRLARGEGKK